MEGFDIITFVGSLTNYDIPEDAAKTIVMRRGLSNIKDYSELEPRDIDLLEADVLYFMYKSPAQTSSKSWGHGDSSERIGTQRVTNKERELMYKTLMSLYRKWGDPRAEEIAELDTTVQWLDVL